MLLVTQRHPVLGPNETEGFEATLRAVSGIGLSASERMAVISLVDSFVRGLARNTVDALEAERRTGVSIDEWWQAQGECLAQVMGDREYPEIMTLGEEGVWGEAEEVAFEFGLTRVLDGIELLVEQRRSS
jgi:hypothetical protein